MQTQRYRLLSLSLALLALLLAGWAKDWDGVRDSMRQVRSIQSEFVQTRRLPLLSRPLVSQGRFLYRSPDDMRWEYVSPVKSVVLLSDGEVSRYTWHDGAFVKDAGARLEAMRVVMDRIAGWLNADFQDNAFFRSELRQGPPAQIVLIPQNPDISTLIEQVVLTLSESPGVIRSIEIRESGESSTTIEFKNVILNEPIADESFTRIP